MAVLQCGVENCTYNQDKCCCKGDILVGNSRAESSKDTCCESFRESKSERVMSAIEHPSKTISIDCEALKCIYNDDYKCQAEKVKIAGNHAGNAKETACATFTEK